MIKIGIVLRHFLSIIKINKKILSYLMMTTQSLFSSYAPGTVLVNGNPKNTLILPLRIQGLFSGKVNDRDER